LVKILYVNARGKLKGNMAKPRVKPFKKGHWEGEHVYGGPRGFNWVKPGG